MIHRLSFAVVAVTTCILAGLALGSPAAAAPGPTGPISCSVFSDVNSQHPKGIRFRPLINAIARNLGFTATNLGSSCDNSGVSGGKAPITGAAFKLTSRLPDGNCAALTSPAPAFKNARIVVRWRGVNDAGKFTTVSKSHARIASAAYDAGTHTLTFTTEPLDGPAFAGKTLTLSLGFDYLPEVFEAGCDDTNGFIAQGFGNVLPASVDVQ